jgi:hypothetical protein
MGIKLTIAGQEQEVEPDKIQELFNNMEADYRRKTQAIADERKAFESEKESLMESANRAEQWDVWWETKGQYLVEPKENLGSQSRNRSRLEEDEENPLELLKKDISTRTEKFEKTIDGISKALGKLERVLRYGWDLDDLRPYHSQVLGDVPFDRDKLMEAAIKYGKPDLTIDEWKMLHDNVYRDEIIKRQVESQVQDKLKTETEKLKTKVASERTPPATFFKPPEENIPTSFNEAAQGALGILSEERAKRGE